MEHHLQTAKDKLKNISEKDSKTDSGIDVDLSEFKLDSGLDIDLSETNSTDDGQLRECNNPKISNIRPDPILQDGMALHRSNSYSGRMRGYRQQRSRTSTTSLQHYYKPTECYDELRESERSNHELVGSVAKSYNLDDNEDTLSYVSSYLPLKSTRRKLKYTINKSEMYSSSETTLSNDQLYPPLDDGFNSDTLLAKSDARGIRCDQSKNKKKHKTPKASYEKTKQGDRTIVRKCYYL